MRASSATSRRILLGVSLLMLWGRAEAQDRVRISSNPALVALWDRLDTARGYRRDWISRSWDEGKKKAIGRSHREMIADYKATARAEFRSLIDSFREVRDSGDSPGGDREEARWGIQESLNEYLVGELLLANQDLLAGLRARFPASYDPSDETLKEALGNAKTRLDDALRFAVANLRVDPGEFRAGTDGGPFVRNAVEGSGQSENVFSDVFQTIDVVRTFALAGDSLAKRIYFFAHKGRNESGTSTDDAERGEAARLFQGTAQSTFLTSAFLASQVSPDAFQRNDGYLLKREVTDAERVFEDILAGFNPLKLNGDFVPATELGVAPYLHAAEEAATKAEEAEAAATGLEREVDQLDTTLRSELEQQRVAILTGGDGRSGIRGILGLTVEEMSDSSLRQLILTPDGRAELDRLAEERMLEHKGDIGIKWSRIEQAVLAAKEVKQQLSNIYELVADERRTSAEVDRIEFSIALERGAVAVAQEMADSCTVCSCGVASGISCKPGTAAAVAKIAGVTLFEAIQNAQISGLRSGQRVRELLLQGASLLISLEGSQKAIEEQKAELDQERGRLRNLVRAYVAADEQRVDAYFANPAYRLQSDRARELADLLFDEARKAAYIAAKALEYSWAEKYELFVRQTNGGLAESLGALYAGLGRAESAFAVASAGSPGSPIPGLPTFVGGLKAWDLKLRSQTTSFTGRDPAPADNVVSWSLRKKVARFDSGDNEFDQIRFTDFLQRHLVPNALGGKDVFIEFPVELGDGRFIPGDPATEVRVPNVRIRYVKVDLRYRPGTLFEGDGNSPIVALEMSGTSYRRSFFARKGDDDIISVALSGARPGEIPPLNTIVDATVDGVSVGPTPPLANTAFAGLSPAASRWALRVPLAVEQNRKIRFADLSDIVIEIGYRFGRADPIS